jgi:hypothetical protein
MISRQKLAVMVCLSLSTLVTIVRCSSSDEPEPVDCNSVNILLETETTAPSGCDASDGTVTLNATGGSAPYQYAVNNGTFTSDNVFRGLAPGNYVLRARDKNDCEQSVNVTIVAGSSNLAFAATTDDSGCKTSDGSITIATTGGASPYEYRLDEGAFGATPEFSGLPAGTYTVTVRDSEGCLSIQNVALTTGVTYDSEIKNILDANCATSGCHVTGGAAPMSLQTYTVAASRAADIKNAVLSNVMPKGGPPLSQELKDKIACWADDNAPQN